MIDRETLHSGLRFVHILAGSLGLAVFWIPVLAKKGGWVHIRAGRLFLWLASVVAGSAFLSCIWALSAPIHFAGISGELPADEVKVLTGNIRFLFGILALLATWFVSGLKIAHRAVKTRRDQLQLGNLWTRITVGIATLASASASGYGAYKFWNAGESRYILYIVLGVIGFGEGIKMLRVFGRNVYGSMDWLHLHMENMLGAGIAFHTAFFVFGARRFWGELPGAWAIVPWLVPCTIGIPAIALWTGYYRRRHERSQGVSTCATVDSSLIT